MTLGSGFSLPTGVAVDNSGNVFVADYNNNALKEIPAGGGKSDNAERGIFEPLSVLRLTRQIIYLFPDYGRIIRSKKSRPVGGYY